VKQVRGLHTNQPTRRFLKLSGNIANIEAISSENLSYLKSCARQEIRIWSVRDTDGKARACATTRAARRQLARS
jgi:hypothetical protein